MKHFIFTLIILSSFSLFSKTSVLIERVDGAIDFEAKNAIRNGLIKTFSNLPERFEVVEDGADIQIKIIVSDGKSKLDIMAKTSGDFITSEKVSGEAAESFILGKIMAIRLAKSFAVSEGKGLSLNEIRQLAGASSEIDSKRIQIIVIPFSGKGIDDGGLELISSEVRNILAKNSRLEVKDKKFMQTQMIDSGLSKKQCEDLSCQLELAGALGVDEAVTGEIVKFGGLVSLSLKRVNIIDSSIKGSVSERLDDTDFKTLLNEIDRLLPKLFPLDSNEKVQKEISTLEEKQQKEDLSQKKTAFKKKTKSVELENDETKETGIITFGLSLAFGFGQDSGFDWMKEKGFDFSSGIMGNFGIYAEYLLLENIFAGIELSGETISFGGNLAEFELSYNVIMPYLGLRVFDSSSLFAGLGIAKNSSGKITVTGSSPTGFDISAGDFMGGGFSGQPSDGGSSDAVLRYDRITSGSSGDLKSSGYLTDSITILSLGYRSEWKWFNAFLEMRFYNDLFKRNFIDGKSSVSGDNYSLIYFGLDAKYSL